MKDLVLSPLEGIINHYLSLDPDSPSRLAKLNGKALKLIVKPVTLYFKFEDDRVKLEQQLDEESIDATLEGSPLSFIQLHFANKENVPKLFKQDLSISGDIDFGQDVRSLFDDMDIDWEENISKVTGDVFAHELTKFINQSSNFVESTASSLQETLTEFLQQETQCLPCREEMEDFFDDIGNLRLRTDRLQAKVKLSQ